MTVAGGVGGAVPDDMRLEISAGSFVLGSNGQLALRGGELAIGAAVAVLNGTIDTSGTATRRPPLS